MQALPLSHKPWLFHMGMAFQEERASQSISVTNPQCPHEADEQSWELQTMGDSNLQLPTLAPTEGK